MTQVKFDCIHFHQYNQDSSGDSLILFAAPAKRIMTWAGIPRKGWQIRMLFQRPIKPAREGDLIAFWEAASSKQSGVDGKFILGPTAIVIAIEGEPKIENNQIDLTYKSEINLKKEPIENIKPLAEILYPKIQERLTNSQKEILSDFCEAPFEKSFPEIEHDYVFEFALQLAQMKYDPESFVEFYQIDRTSQDEMVRSMESICRPAIVVDGQHRLWGASSVSKEIILPVVAIPYCNWTEQIYQFVVINEKSERVETSLLTDIFGSSLTKTEQEEVRGKLELSKVDVEGRIAATIAAREPESPFYNMVQIKIEGTPPPGYNPYLSEGTIRRLMDGTQKYSRGWRVDDEFYNLYVKPKFLDRASWDSWKNGAWKNYWNCFWVTVRDYYNEQARKVNISPIWDASKQSNLTKAVTLRIFQTLFMVKCIERMQDLEKTEPILRESLGDEVAEEKIFELRQQRSIPENINDFREFVVDFFLDQGIPLRVFTAKWKSSLDDAQGQLELWETLETAFERTKKNDRFHCRGRIFEAADES